MDAFDLRQWNGYSLSGQSLADPAIIDQIVIDTRRIDSPHSLFVALKGNHADGHSYLNQAALAGAKFALVSQQFEPSQTYPGMTLLRVPDTLKAFQSIAKAYRLQLSTKIMAITGSFGKTMVKDLLYTLLCKAKPAAASPGSFNSQIGVPLSLFTLSQNHEVAVIEAAISQKDEMDILAEIISPDYTLLTPVGKKHLATLNDLPTLTQEIFKLINATSSKGWTLIPHDPSLTAYYPQLPCSKYFWDQFNSTLPHAALGQSTSSLNYHLTFPDAPAMESSINSGFAYYLNLLNMSIKAAWLMGVSSSHIKEVLQSYEAEPSRTEIWKSSIGATFVNDTSCYDPQSVDQALCHFNYATAGHRKIFVFGGIRGQPLNQQTDYRRIGKALANAQVRHLLLVGRNSFKPLIDEVHEHAVETEILAFKDYTETFSYLQQHLQSEDLIIFKGDRKLSLDQLTETFNDSVANNQCIINLAAIQDNISLIRRRLPEKTRLMVIVKALAYGTDDVRMAKFLSTCGVDILGVSYVDEGVALKRAGVQQAIFSINAAPYEAAKVIKWGLEVGVSDRLLIDALAHEGTSQNKRCKVHLHINTGMGRFGCRPEEALGLARLIQSYSSLELEGLMTHFACADDPKEDDFTLGQTACFDSVIQELGDQGITVNWTHAANSSGALRFGFSQYNMVRLGLAVYGLYVSDSTQQSLDLRLALSLTSRIVGINICKQGETVSYGRNFQVTRETQKIAVLPIGYFDGLHRNYSGKAHVLIRGQKAPMVGNICMDYMMVDVTDIPHAAVGDKVLIFGEDEFGHYLSPEELARRGDSIVHELITCLGPRIQRIFVFEEGKQIR